MKEEIVQSFYTPKLTEEELKLVEDENIDYEKTFRFGFYSCEEAKWEMNIFYDYIFLIIFIVERKKKLYHTLYHTVLFTILK